MDDYIEQDEYRSQIASLNGEIRELTQRLEQKEYIDKFNAFDNPTEYRGFGGNYAKVHPKIELRGYELPFEPKYEERRAIKHFYSIGGWCTLLQFAVSTLASTALIHIVIFILRKVNPEISPILLQEYAKGSSIVVSLNMLIFLFCNVFLAFLGMKLAGIKPRSVIATKEFSFGLAVQYCMTALFIWVVAMYVSTGIDDIFRQYGFDTVIDHSSIGKTTLGKVILNIYICIIAPLTEELFFRGMLLKVLSKANQRFAIFSTAVFFGLAHGNIPQFLLAFLLGIFLAHITMKHSSIIPSVIVHMFINTFSTMFGYLGEAGDTIQKISMLLLFAAAVLGLITFLIFYGDNRLPLTTPKQATRGLDIAICSLPFNAAFVTQVIYMTYVLVSNE